MFRDVEIKRALRISIAAAVFNNTMAKDSVYFERRAGFTLEELPAIAVSELPPTEQSDPNRTVIAFLVSGTLVEPFEPETVRAECGLCLDPLVELADLFDSEIGEALTNDIVMSEECLKGCNVIDVSASVRDYNEDGKRRLAYIRRQVSVSVMGAMTSCRVRR